MSQAKRCVGRVQCGPYNKRCMNKGAYSKEGKLYCETCLTGQNKKERAKNE